MDTEAVAAWATVAAVVVALFLPTITAWWRHRHRPLLSLADDPANSAEEKWVYKETGQDSLAWFVRLAVSNAKGKRTAQGVEVIVSQAKQLGDGGKVVRLPSPALGWTSSLEAAPFRTIGPDMERALDLGWVIQPGGGGDVRFQIGIQEPGAPQNKRHHLEPGRWRLDLDVMAENGPAKPYAVTVRVENEWLADGRCVTVETVEERQ